VIYSIFKSVNLANRLHQKKAKKNSINFSKLVHSMRDALSVEGQVKGRVVFSIGLMTLDLGAIILLTI
jgi:hypothetical protein